MWRIFLLMLLAAGCTTEDESVLLRLSLKPGDKYRTYIRSHQQIAMGLDGKVVKSAQLIKLSYLMEVLPPEDSLQVVRYTHEGRQIDQVLDGDTTRAEENSLQSLLGIDTVSYTFYINPKGQIKRIAGEAEARAKLVTRLRQYYLENQLPMDNFEAQVDSLWQAGLADLKKSFELTWTFYPAEEVSEGDTWQLREEDNEPLPRITKTTYTMDEIWNNVVAIKFASDILPKDKETNIEGQQEGELAVNRHTGTIQSGHIKQILQGSRIVGQGDEPIRTPFRLNSETDIRTEEVK